MIKFYQKLIVMLLLCMAGCLTVQSQYVKVEIIVKSVYIDYNRDGDKSYGGRFRFYYNQPTDQCGYLLHNFCNDANRRCIQTPWEQKIYQSDIWTPLNTITLSPGTTAFTIFMRTHHERQKDCTMRSSEECTVEHLGCGEEDRHELTTNMTVNLANFAPGVFSTLGRMVNNDGTLAYADLLIRYTINTPAIPKPQPNPSANTFCAQDILELNTDVKPNNTGLQYTWEYARASEDYEIWNPDKDYRNYEDPIYGCGHWEYYDGNLPRVINPATVLDIPTDPSDGTYWVRGFDCDLPDYITVHNWRPLIVTNSNYDRFARFSPLGAVFRNNITTRSGVYFHVKATSTDGLVSSWSDPSLYTFLPAPPTLDASKFTVKPSCSFPNTGRVTIPYNAITTGVTQVRWLVKYGHYNNSTCTIVFNSDGSISSTCGLIEKKSNGLVNVPKTATDAPIVIDSLPKGEYTLWLINPGESSGSCYTPLNITIGEYGPLTLDKISAQNLSCFNTGDGAFKVQAGGGDASDGYQFKLEAKNHPSLNMDFTTISGNVFERANLPADEYSISMKNACTPEKKMVITLTQPVRTKGSGLFNQPSCYDPANGNIITDVTEGMGKYTYQLTKDGNPHTAITGVPEIHQLFDNLLPGTYTLKILDADRTSCAGWDTSFTLVAPPVIGATVQSIDSVSCFGSNDGKVTVTGYGANNHYVFTLKNNITNVAVNNTDGLFSNLVAGTYTLTTARPANENCNDQQQQTIIIPQRIPLAVTLQVDSVTCKGDADGRITAYAAGGSGSYTYYWEYLDGATWKHDPFWFSTDTQIKLLSPGKYRVTVFDSKSTAACNLVSQEINVEEPLLLTIANVQAIDAACKADGGRIKIITSGGNGGNQYFYSLGDQTNYIPFTENTPLNATGSYYVKVTDYKGCTVESNTPYAITLPAVPLNFTLTASDYEGWSVSCYQGANGIITVAAAGGSGSGYTYRLGSGTYQTGPEFRQLPAGTHTVSVLDTRGCVVTKDIVLTAPDRPIAGTIVDKKEVDCPGTATGAFRINVQYGRPPYQYSIDNGTTFQSSNFFDKLYTGTYPVLVKDKYDCSWSQQVTLTSVVSPVQFTNTIKHVSCFDGSDGAVTVSARNGAPPYQYNWITPANTTNGITGLKTGQYVLRITDAAACLHYDTVLVEQPAAPLTATVNTHPVCVGSNGTITLLATGGTAPYQYSIDEGNRFQDSPLFADLPASTYPVVITDDHHCPVAYKAVINPANAMPDINFLVASGKNALDTLVIREISMPVPDSVQWTFDPAAMIIDNSNVAPRIRFNNTGRYWIIMKGYFKGCDYSLRKFIDIKPYDPDAGLVFTPPIRIIDTVVLYPNPNTGQFSVKVKMNKKQKLVLMVQDMGTGREVTRRLYDPQLVTDDQFALGNIAPGTYLLRVITENDSRDVLFIINR